MHIKTQISVLFDTQNKHHFHYLVILPYLSIYNTCFFTKSIYWARVRNRCAPLPFPKAPSLGSRLISLAHPHPLCTRGGAIMALHLPPNPSPHPRPSVCVHPPGLGCTLHCCHVGDGVPPHHLLWWLDRSSALPLPLARHPFAYGSHAQMGRRAWDGAGNGGGGDSIPLASLARDEGGRRSGGREPEGEGRTGAALLMPREGECARGAGSRAERILIPLHPLSERERRRCGMGHKLGSLAGKGQTRGGWKQGRNGGGENEKREN